MQFSCKKRVIHISHILHRTTRYMCRQIAKLLKTLRKVTYLPLFETLTLHTKRMRHYTPTQACVVYSSAQHRSSISNKQAYKAKIGYKAKIHVFQVQTNVYTSATCIETACSKRDVQFSRFIIMISFSSGVKYCVVCVKIIKKQRIKQDSQIVQRDISQR